MKAPIVYDDATCAATTNAILHRAADLAYISVKWDIRPWRLNMLRITPTAEEAVSDAADAHLIVFAIRNTQSLPTWLMSWLERWAALRQIPDATLPSWAGTAPSLTPFVWLETANCRKG